MKRARFVGVAIALSLCASQSARADGAFPDELGIFLPPTRPHEIVLVTNFGLLLSSDDGVTFKWICEQAITNDPLGNAPVWRYQRGGDGALYGLFADQVAHSVDNGCGWSTTQLPDEGFDLFADPTMNGRLFAIWQTAGQASGEALVSTDQGASFPQTLYSSPAGRLFGIESSFSAPETIYVSGFHSGLDGGTAGPYLARTDNNGETFVSYEHPEVGETAVAFIAQVDPHDPMTVYLRVGSSVPDSLYVTHDGGETWEKLFGTNSTMTAFQLGADGSLYVATRENLLYVRAPGASEFEPLSVPHIRCLGERDGVLYACRDNTIDGYALGRSRDHGRTWEPVLRFDQIADMVDCPGVRATCKASWATLGQQFNFGINDAGPDETPNQPKGCGCAGAESVGWSLLLAIEWVRRRGQRHRR